MMKTSIYLIYLALLLISLKSNGFVSLFPAKFLRKVSLNGGPVGTETTKRTIVIDRVEYESVTPYSIHPTVGIREVEVYISFNISRFRKSRM